MSAPGGPPPLRPFGLVLHRDGHWSHEGRRVTNPRLRAVFDRGVRFLPEVDTYVVQVGHFRGQIEIEEAAFFVRSVDPETGEIVLSDASVELLDPSGLRASSQDDAWLCRVKQDLAPGGLLARFTHAAWAQLLEAVEETSEGPALRLAGRLHLVADV
jgi:hypothetical protein